MDPDPLKQLVSVFPPLIYVGGGFGLWKVITSGAKEAEEVLSKEAKEGISQRLKRFTPDSVQSWPVGCFKLFTSIFGERHFSLRCLFTSFIASCIAVAFLTALYLATGTLFGPASDILRVAGWVLLLNAGFDYIALWIIRIVLRSSATSNRLAPIWWMILSFLLIFVIATNAALNIGFMAAMFTAGTFLDPLSWVLTLYGNFALFLPALVPAMRMKIPAGIFFWSTFYIWFWVLLYASAESLLTSARWMEKVRGFLNVDEKPVAAIGFVMGGLAAFLWWSICLARWALHK